MSLQILTKQAVFNAIYPVGSIYMSINKTEPSTLFGGTWERIKGYYLLGVDENTKMEHSKPNLYIGDWKTKSHTLTIAEMPKHNHPTATWLFNGSSASGTHYGMSYQHNTGMAYTTSDEPDGDHGIVVGVNNNGGSQGHTHDFVPISYTVYMWKRTA